MANNDSKDLSDLINVDQIQSVVQSEQFNQIFSQVTSSLSKSGFIDENIQKLDSDNLGSLVSSCVSTVNNILPSVVDTIGNIQKGGNKDLNLDIDISLQEAYSGIKKKMTVKRKSWDSSINEMYTEKKRFVFNILPGVEDNHVITLEKEGDVKSASDDTRSDIKITLHIEDHKEFYRNGNDLIKVIPTSLSAFGKKTYYFVELLNKDKVALYIDDDFKIQNRLIGLVEGKGMPIQNDEDAITFGDLYVVFSIDSGCNVVNTNEENLKEFQIVSSVADDPRL